jgi:XTP/dITP diphosphohydrolase
MDTVYGTERAIAASRRDTDVPTELDVAVPLGAVSEDEWRRHWPSGSSAEPFDIPAVPEVVSEDDLLDVDDLVNDIELDEPEPSD